MPTHHDEVELVAGDSWTILGTLFDESGDALDLTNAALAWTLLGTDGLPVGAVTAVATVTRNNPLTDGKVTITIPQSATDALLAGRYHDALRVVIGELYDTVWIGAVLVSANPFVLPEA